jgi:hypothetical protein
LNEVSGRLLVNIIDRYLRPTRHLQECAARCSTGCPVHEYEANLAEPVLPSEIRAAHEHEARLRAFAAQANGEV